MIIKLYEEIKRIIKENVRFLTLVLFAFLICYIPLPYYIYAPGGLVDVGSRFEIKNEKPIKDKFFMAYVSEYKATIPTYLMSKIKKDWELIDKKEVVATNETVEESDLRSKLMLEEANIDAIITAFNAAGKKVEIEKEDLIISYVDPKSKTDLRVNDVIIKVNDKTFKDKKELQDYLNSLKPNKNINMRVKRDNKEINAKAKTRSIDGKTKIGIMISSLRTIKTTPEITFKFKDSESGPSGGFMMSLAIYDTLTKKNIAGNLKIAGTGTIDAFGNVGEIGGIKHKISGANKDGADIFFAPSGKNYRDAIKYKNDNNYDIEIIEIKTFNDALKYLHSLEK